MGAGSSMTNGARQICTVPGAAALVAIHGGTPAHSLQPNPRLPRTIDMDFLITAGAFKKAGAEAYRAEEDRVVDELRAEGVLSAAYRRTDGAGVFGIAHGTDLASVKAELARLPFVAHGFMEFEFVEVVPL
jgi:muconolactone delta-isomerase